MPAEVMAAARRGASSGRLPGAAGGGSGVGTCRSAIRLTLSADPVSVRRALVRIGAELLGAGIAETDAANAELVLAEVLNNVVEHAFQDGREGRIELALAAEEAGLTCEVRDDGRPMPGGALPAGLVPVCGEALATLPEGGFGWFLIHALARDLAYARKDGVNVLALRIPLGEQVQVS
jgi:serine/threonine-protein kinase RsbW